jgi:cystathionine gamma-synthase
MRDDLRPESLLVRAGRPDPTAGAPVNHPVVLTATFHAGAERGYARSGNDSIDAFEAALGAVEGGTALAFSSGIAATTALIEGLPVGSVVVAPTSFYNVHGALFDTQVELGRLVVRTVEPVDTAETIAALDGAAVLWLELPSNPMLSVPDLPALSAAAAERGVLTVVDATLATPLGIRSLEHGADVVMHSVTKWIGGHSDLLCGALVVADPALAARLTERRTQTGALPGSLEVFLALRGLRTLAVRVERASANAAVLADRLADHPSVTAVLYPGRPDHPQAERVAALLDNPGCVVSFCTDTVARADRLCERVRLITHATSLGGVESLIERRGAYDPERRQGTPAELLRLSVGIEHVEDLWHDLDQALRT